MNRTLVLGIGNALLSDEGVGVHVIEFMRRQRTLCQRVACLDGGTLGFTLASELEAVDNLIVIDATQLGERPGTVQCMSGVGMDRYLRHGRPSVHEVGLRDLLDIARLTDTLPANRALVGIQPQSVGWGDRPTAVVAAAIPVAADRIERLIAEWRGG